MSAPGPFGEDVPAPILFPLAPPHPRPLTPPIPPNLPTHSESLSSSPSHPQLGEDVTPQRYGLRRSTCETRIPHREGNIYGKDRHSTDILRRPEWRRHLGEADPDMAHRMPENAHRHIQVQPDTIPIAGVYYPFNQVDNTVNINGTHYEVEWVGQRPILINIEGNRIDVPPPADESATTAITNYMVRLAKEGGVEHICFLLVLRAAETHLPKTFKDVANLPADSRKRWLESCLEELKSLKDKGVYDVVDLSKGRRAVKNRWVFNVKPDCQEPVFQHRVSLWARP